MPFLTSNSLLFLLSTPDILDDCRDTTEDDNEHSKVTGRLDTKACVGGLLHTQVFPKLSPSLAVLGWAFISISSQPAFQYCQPQGHGHYKDTSNQSVPFLKSPTVQ